MKSHWKRNWGLVGALPLGAVFVLSVIKVVLTTSRQHDPDVPTLRISHWLLETGYRESIAEVGRLWVEENARHGRTVRFEQLVVPTKVYAAWMRTNLVGRMAPDLVYVKRENGATDEIMGRYFESLSEEAAKPNPYNADTPLAGVRWSDTFVDGLAITGTSPGLADIYAIPTTAVSVRLYYNRALLREITGRDALPVNFGELLETCAQIRSWATRHGRRVAPIAGSRYNTTLLFNLLIGGLTQATAVVIDERGDLGTGPAELLQAASRGRWSPDRPEVRTTFNAIRTISAEMQPGFLQLQREDATMQFGQQQAVMIVAGSWAANSMHAEVPFELGVAALPLPPAGDSQWGTGVRGPAGDTAGLFFEGFAMPVGGTKRALAVDFLRFFSSWKIYSHYASQSGCLPVVKHVQAAGRMQPFALRKDGYRPGPTFYSIGESTRRLWEQNTLTLVGPTGSTDAFIKLLQHELPATLASDLARWRRDLRNSIELQDLLLEARHQLAPGASGADAHWGALLDTQSAAESQYYASFLSGQTPAVRP
jgi:ABC-type glycerol-3-phosphate transport system substrate-binding protein